MPIYIKQYYDEIINRLLEDKIEVKHFILSASKNTIINRLIARGEASNSWAEQHINKCLKAFETDMPGLKISAENKSVTEVAKEITALV